MDNGEFNLKIICVLVYLFPYLYLFLSYWSRLSVFKNDKIEFFVFVSYLITAFCCVVYIFTSGAR